MDYNVSIYRYDEELVALLERDIVQKTPSVRWYASSTSQVFVNFVDENYCACDTIDSTCTCSFTKWCSVYISVTFDLTTI